VAQWRLSPAVAVCGNPQFGDYQCNNAMALFQRLRSEPGGQPPPASPRAVAEALLRALPPSPLVESTRRAGRRPSRARARSTDRPLRSIAGPGFINVTLSRPALADRLVSLLRDGAGAWAPPPPPGVSRAIVDYSSPNVAKEMHVGHLRSTILGETLALCLEYTGVSVLRLNHVGDWGTQFGMLIEHLADQPAAHGQQAAIADLQALYKASKARFDAEPDFKARAQAAVVRLQAGGEAELAAWRRICAVSRAEFEALYARLGVEGLVERGESYYNGMVAARLAELAEKGVSSVSDGATVFFAPGAAEGAPPLIVRKSDGGYGYGSSDLAALWHRLTVERADWLLYVTDVGQASHFAAVFAAGRAAGWLPGDPAAPPRADHVSFGLVLGEDGKRFRTRSSETVRLAELLDEAESRCAAALRSRAPGGGGEAWSEAELAAAARAMGVGAVKYADLSSNRTSNYAFSFDRMLDLKGNTAVYLLYAHARICSIVRKAGLQPGSGEAAAALRAQAARVEAAAPEEAALLLALCRFPEAVEAVLAELMPNRLTDYLYDLSAKFNEFYAACTVLGSEQQASRLQLCEATALVMRQCFRMLGITPLMRL